ncbi:hAT transposon superfamily [Striga hermonthica]|uniref:HAT transposon superfamily n=1 Tax=Striga hermonthica TaxID=68872 RepID=A0A9N7MPL5_STRHE|nr:hAT transposon superfamily [Striga hermonthica]
MMKTVSLRRLLCSVLFYASAEGQRGIFSLMVREKDACWEYADRLEGNKVRCKFCDRILNGGISRLKHHLSRLPSKGVNPCAKVRDDVSHKVREIIALKDDGKENPVPRRQILSPEVKSPPEPPIQSQALIAKPVSSIMPLTIPPRDEHENAERCIALFFFENKLDFGVARSPSYHQMIDAIKKCGNNSGFVGPTVESLRMNWLGKIKSEMQLWSKGIEKEWAMTGCTVIAETWGDGKSRALINFLISSPSGTFFHKSVDASMYYKNVKYLSDLFDSVIQDFGAENVVHVIIDDALNFPGLANHILQNYGLAFVTPCASQCMNGILEEFCKVDWVNQCILQAQAVSKYVYNNLPALDMMKNFTGGQDIIRTGVTKYVSNFLSLQSMLKHKSRLKHMFNSPEFTTDPTFANRPQTATCVGILDDGEFWRAVEESVAVSEPFLRVMREVAGGKPAVGFVYEMMTRAKESIRTYYIMDEVKCKTFLDIVDRKWQNSLHSPLHSAAAFLNPGVQYNPEVKFLGSIKEEFFRVLEKLLPTPELRRDITNQILLFTRGSGMFGCSLAKEAIDTVSPGIWWEQFGDGAPMLQRVAIRILSQVCSTCNFEKQWTASQQIHSEKRNKIDKETLNDLLYVHYNLRLEKSLKTNHSENDPLQMEDLDMTSDWVEEADSPSPVQWLDRFGSALEGGDVGDLNTRQFSAAIYGAGDNIFNL